MDIGESAKTTDSVRLESLRWALEVTRSSIEEAEVDKRSPLIGQYRALLGEIAELEGATAEPARKVNGLVILQEELAKRKQSGSSDSRRAARRNF